MIDKRTLTDKWRPYAVYLAATVVIGFLGYFSMIALELHNNFDGIWHLSNFIAGDWEIQLGRSFERYADRFRFGIVSFPLNALLCLTCAGISHILIIRRFDWKGTWKAWILVFLLTVNPIVSETLSYIYLAVNYFLGYVFSVASFYILSDPEGWYPHRAGNGNKDTRRFSDIVKSLRYILTGALFLAVSMEFYQAYFSVLCTLLLFYGIKQAVECVEIKKLKYYYINGFAGILAGGLIYFILTKLMLLHANVELASYKGAASVSLTGILFGLPGAVVQSYRDFFAYIFVHDCRMNLEFIEILMVVIMCMIAMLIVFRMIMLFRTSAACFVVFTVSIAAMPIAGCAILVLVPGVDMSGLMCMSCLMCIVMSMVYLPQVKEDPRVKRTSPAWIASVVCIILMLSFGWYALSTVANDQLALREGKTSTVSLAGQMISELAELGELPELTDEDSDVTVAFVGRPADNPMFAHSISWNRANEYARFGLFSTDPRNNRVSWYGVLTNFVGLELPLCDDVTFDELRKNDEVASMPAFPAKGSIRRFDGVVVVKVSDVYE